VRGTWQTTDGGGGGLVLVLVLVLIAAAAILIGSGAVSAAVSALVTILIIAAVVTGLAVLGGTALLVHRARQGRPAPPIQARPSYWVRPAEPPGLGMSEPLAIEPGREIHLHLNVTPDQLAAILRHYSEGEL
jgi:hypothetical protein